MSEFMLWSGFHSIFGRVLIRRFYPPKDVEFLCASFDLDQKFARGCPPTQTPTQKLKSGFLRFSSQEIGSSLLSLEVIFEALQSELPRFNLHALSLKIPKIPEFNLVMIK